MRGKQQGYSEEDFDRRITPADAGKTLIGFMVGCSAEDHPRGCGENVCLKNAKNMQIGSPPRMRGKQSPASGAFWAAGITPADAGKTPRIALIGQLCWDHPRGCGENSSVIVFFCFEVGSPPRMRGKREDLPELGFNLRITPADAGKTIIAL